MPGTGHTEDWGWLGNTISLGELGTLELEWRYLSDVTGDPRFADHVKKLRDRVEQKGGVGDGLYGLTFHQNGVVGQRRFSIGGQADSFYEYLLKSWLIAGGAKNYVPYWAASSATEVAPTLPSTPYARQALRMYTSAMRGVLHSHTHVASAGEGEGGAATSDERTYIQTPGSGRMEHLACFTGGMLALGSATSGKDGTKETAIHRFPKKKLLAIGKGLALTCRTSYAMTPSGLGPDVMSFGGDHKLKRGQGGDAARWELRPEAVESYFYMWRLTHDPKYRQWGWELVQAIEKHCRGPFGYAGLKNVWGGGRKMEVQNSWFLAEVLKYLFLLFSDDDVLPLDQWVMNTEGHPLPVEGHRGSNAEGMKTIPLS